MPRLSIIFFMIIIEATLSFGQDKPIEKFYSVVADPSDYAYVEKLEDLIHGERWGFHSGPIGMAKASTVFPSQGQNSYRIENIEDLNLETAWIEGRSDYGIGEFFSIEFDWKEKNQGFGQVYNFYGVVEIFNGYCKSEQHWIENSRIKTLKMYYNDQPICLIELQDSWQHQRLDLTKLFQPNGPIHAQDGDVLKFEIIDIYMGSKYKDTALSEFVFESPSN